MCHCKHRCHGWSVLTGAILLIDHNNTCTPPPSLNYNPTYSINLLGGCSSAEKLNKKFTLNKFFPMNMPTKHIHLLNFQPYACHNITRRSQSIESMRTMILICPIEVNRFLIDMWLIFNRYLNILLNIDWLINCHQPL